MTKKPLWLRLYQSYYTWRSGTLIKLGFCCHCGWRRLAPVSKHACYHCLEDHLPSWCELVGRGWEK